MNSSLSDYLHACQVRVNNALDQILPTHNQIPTHLHEAMRYAVLNGGKRLRPALVYATGELLNDPTSEVLPLLDAAACAVELIHCYSLVHDDLPSMDNDSLRRGKPTCHVKYDEATAILVGDALQSLAFQCLANGRLASNILVISELSRAAGSLGMAGGQALDIESTGKQLNIDELKQVHEMKTGSLIIAAVRMAALSSYHIGEEQLKALTQYASTLGLAFQVHDDILDVEGSQESLGKTTGKDATQDKNTYTKILGLDQAKQYAKELNKKTIESLQSFDQRADRLRQLADYAISRQH
jgi:farnesyl diphosphate synthase